MSFFASPTATQRRLSDRSQRQRLKNGKKGSKWSIDAIVAAMWPQCQEPTWSLSTALYVGSTKLTYDHSKTSGEIGSWVRQIREQATWSITLLGMFTKLRWLSWKSSAQELGVSQHLRQSGWRRTESKGTVLQTCTLFLRTITATCSLWLVLLPWISGSLSGWWTVSSLLSSWSTHQTSSPSWLMGLTWTLKAIRWELTYYSNMHCVNVHDMSHYMHHAFFSL